MLCDECLSLGKENVTDSHSIQDGIVADSQVGEDLLWRRPFPLSSQSQILLAQHSQQRFVVASSIDEDVMLDMEGDSNHNVEKREAEGFVTPEGKRPAASASSSVHTSPHSSSQHSRQGTPFRTGLKAAVVASSIFDIVATAGKKEKKVNESPRKTRAKKSMIQSHAITNYFLKKPPKDTILQHK